MMNSAHHPASVCILILNNCHLFDDYCMYGDRDNNEFLLYNQNYCNGLEYAILLFVSWFPNTQKVDGQGHT